MGLDGISAAPYTNDEGEIDGSVSVIRDVSEQVAAEQALAASESRFRHITEHASDMIIRARVQPMFAFEYLSPAVEAVTGYSVAELYANPSALSISSESSDLDLSEIVADPAAFASGVFKARHKDGHDIWLEHNASVIEEPDGGLVVEAVIRDITIASSSSLLICRNVSGHSSVKGRLGHSHNRESISTQHLMRSPNMSWVDSASSRHSRFSTTSPECFTSP